MATVRLRAVAGVAVFMGMAVVVGARVVGVVVDSMALAAVDSIASCHGTTYGRGSLRSRIGL